jgi:hypothetical protein
MRSALVVCALTLFPLAAGAQTGSSPTATGQSSAQASTSQQSPAPETRPATPTFLGDTG